MGETNDVISRRRFAGSVASGVALSAASYRRVLGANDRVGVGFIGFGLIGKRHVLDFQASPTSHASQSLTHTVGGWMKAGH